jgi:zinc transporter ZupT
MPFLARAGLTVVWFFATLIFEVLLAMAIYVYIRLNHRGFFDRLTDFSFDVLNVVRGILRSSTPGLAERANVALVSDLSAGAMLLLMLGLCASGLIRIIVWTVRTAIHGARRY